MAGLTSELLSQATFEVIPMKSTLEKAASLPAGSSVSVTASPAKGIEATIDLAIALHDIGYRSVPHLAARMI
ncbi:MAG: methylenetetrahydrofolate reductase, partial [Acidimicrobiia bacterium]